MSNLLAFVLTKKIRQKRNEDLVRQRAEYLYRITRGFEFLNQDPDVREQFENGSIEL